MNPKIIRLSEEVIHKIAAGEIVENPASIVKELIENSLDAGATRIEISMWEGGNALLQVEDNGSGMDRDNALLSLERHATSKIQTENDLFALSTMGFRGEALAAISAVSLFEMRTSEKEIGTRIEMEGRRLVTEEPCARNKGTSISVRDLFFNVPARKKFLKKASTNGSHVERVVETVALAHSDVFFSLKSNGKVLLELEPQEKKKRLQALFPEMSIEVISSGVWGLLAPPEEAKTQRRGQYLFVNQRPIFSPLIAKAVQTGFGSRVDEGLHPAFILFLKLAPDLIDVNVHPQKKEIRFANEKQIFRDVEQAVELAFQTPAISFTKNLTFSPAPLFFTEELPVRQEERRNTPSFDFSFPLRPLAIIDGFCLLQSDELLLIDLKKAYARVLYESLQTGTAPKQTLLWPIEAPVQEEKMVEELKEMGIECRWIGKKTIAIDALPSFLEANDFLQFLDTWAEGRKLNLTTCRYASASKKKFTPDEACLLWQALLKCSDSVYDPMGHKIWSSLNAEQFKKLLEKS